MNQVAALYDALHDFESRYRRGIAYPVHKRLQFPDPSMTDIYDWIIAEVGLPETGAILDAGCGTGFGSLRLAEASQCAVTGISISPREIAAAKRAAASSPAGERLDFRVQNFDEVPGGSFDLVIAVESLKHSANLSRTLEILQSALRCGGKFVVIEDCLTASAGKAAHQLADAWHLEHLFCEIDITARLRSTGHKVVDLTGMMVPSTAGRRARRHAAEIALTLIGWALPVTVRQALKGGYILQRLYDRNDMSYLALIA